MIVPVLNSIYSKKLIVYAYIHIHYGGRDPVSQILYRMTSYGDDN
jgi:hypothetical protein